MSNFTFVTPPQNQGQIVETSYAETESGLVRRRVDRSDGSVDYAITAWSDALVRWSDNVGPQNSPPPKSACRWRPVSQDEDSDQIWG